MTKMDAHLVGYGSSSDDDGKPRKQQEESNSTNKERNFRKHEKSQGDKMSPSKDDFEGFYKTQKDTERDTRNNKDTSVQQTRSLSPLQRTRQPTGKSPERRQRNRSRRSRSRSRSSSASTDKESKSAVDEFGRRVRHQHSEKTKDEDRTDDKNRRRYSRDQRKSRSKSREKDRGGYHHHERRREDRYSDRRRYSDRSSDRGRSPKRSRDHSPRRSRDRSVERPRNRSQERSREHSPDRTRGDRRGHVFLGGTEKRPVVSLKDKQVMSSEEIEKRLAARAQSLKQVAQENAANLNLPSYLNPAVVNPQLYAKQQEKRKLLWSSKKTEQTPSNSKIWVGTKFAGDQGGEVQAKFRRLMGIKEGESGGAAEEEGSSTGDKILTDLEKEFERSRAFQLSRGAGGKSGVGLGYAPAGYN